MDFKVLCFYAFNVSNVAEINAEDNKKKNKYEKNLTD